MRHPQITTSVVAGVRFLGSDVQEIANSWSTSVASGERVPVCASACFPSHPQALVPPDPLVRQASGLAPPDPRSRDAFPRRDTEPLAPPDRQESEAVTATPCLSPISRTKSLPSEPEWELGSTSAPSVLTLSGNAPRGHLAAVALAASAAAVRLESDPPEQPPGPCAVYWQVVRRLCRGLCDRCRAIAPRLWLLLLLPYVLCLPSLITFCWLLVLTVGVVLPSKWFLALLPKAMVCGAHAHAINVSWVPSGAPPRVLLSPKRFRGYISELRPHPRFRTPRPRPPRCNPHCQPRCSTHSHPYSHPHPHPCPHQQGIASSGATGILTTFSHHSHPLHVKPPPQRRNRFCNRLLLSSNRLSNNPLHSLFKPPIPQTNSCVYPDRQPQPHPIPSQRKQTSSF